MAVRVIALLRLGFGLLTAAALGYNADRVVVNGTGLVNFFSYFTILSNIGATVVLLSSAAADLGGTARLRVPDSVRGAVVLYMVITGLVYAIALSGYTEVQPIPWVNDVVHRIIPVVMVVDWLAVPPRRRIPIKAVGSWLLFPLAYLGYTLIRGPVVHWYPYPFLNPAKHGYGHVAVSCVLVALAFVVSAALLAGIGGALSGRWGRDRAADGAY